MEASRHASAPGVALAVGGGAFAIAVWAGSDAEVASKLGLLAWSLVAAGLLAGYLPRAIPPREARPLLAGLAALVVLSALALTATGSAERTLDEVARAAGYAGIATLGLMLIGPGRWRSAAAGLAIAAVVVCSLSLFARLAPDAAPRGVGGERLSYPVGYWNALAAWCAMTIAILVAWAGGGRDRATRAAAIAALPVAGVCLYLTYSRGGLLTALLGVGVAVALSAQRRRTLTYTAAAAAASAIVVLVIRAQPEIARGEGAGGAGLVALALAGACAACWLLARHLPLPREPVRRRQRAPLTHGRAVAIVAAAVAVLIAFPLAYAVIEGDEPAGAAVPADPEARVLSLEGDRPQLWKAALDAGAAEPVRGIGPGTFEFWWAREGAEPELVRDAHSFYLEQFAELGLAGMMAAAVGAAGILWLALTPLRRGDDGAAAVAVAAASVVFVAYLGIDWIWESTAVAVLGLAVAVVAGSGAARSVRRHAGGGGSRRGGLAGPPRAALVAVALAGTAVQVPGLVAASRIEASKGALVAGHLADASELAGEAVTAEPWAASPYAQRAEVEITRGDYDAARDQLVEAVERERENFRHWLALASVEAELGHAVAARGAFERAEALAPRANLVTGGTGEALRGRIEDLEAGGPDPGTG
ncbi:MAG: O-antigen ligase family protein [Solirubrobacterales bacterium]